MAETIANYNVVLELITKQSGDIKKIDSEVKGLQGTFERAKKAFVGLFVAGAVTKFGQAIFDTTAKYQQYLTILTNSLGSQKAANEAFALIKDIGRESVFSVDEMTGAYIKFINRGIKPTREQFVSFTDLAASQGKSIDQLTEAILDATTGEFERLKEFGIKANKEGDKIKLSFKGQAIEVQNTAKAINEALIGFGQLPGVLGSNAVQMDTLNGRVSLIKDSIDELLNKIGQKLMPVFKALLSVVSSVIAGLSTFVDVLAGIPKFIEENATALKLLAVGLVSFNGHLILNATLTLRAAVASKAKAVADLFLAKNTNILAAAQRAFNLALRANPIGVVITAIAALAAGFVTLYKNVESVRNVIAGLKQAFVGTIKDVILLPIRLAEGFAKDGFKGVLTVFNDTGKKASQEFHKGYEENERLESLKRRSGARKGTRGLGGPDGISATNDRLREERLAREKEIAEENKANLEAALKRELEAAEKRFLQKEIEAKRTIEDEKKLTAALEKLEIEREIELNEIKARYAKGIDALEIESSLIDLRKNLLVALRKTDLGGVVAAEILSGFERLAKDNNNDFKKTVGELFKRLNLIPDNSPLKAFFDDPSGAVEEDIAKNIQNLADRMAKRLKAYQKEEEKPFFQAFLGLDDEQFAKFKTDLERAESLIKQSVNSILQNEIDANDRRIEAQEERVAKAEKLAEKGNIRQLEIEEEKLSKLQEKRQKFVNAQRALDELQILSANAVAAAQSIQVITAAFASGGPAAILTGVATGVALAAQIAAILATVKGSFADIPNFWEGSELIGADPRYRRNKVTSGRDGYVFRGDGSERIVDGATNAKLNGFPNAKLPDAVAIYKLLPTIKHDKLTKNDKSNAAILKKIGEMQEAFEAMRFEVNLDAQGFAARMQKLEQNRISRKRYTA